MELHVHLHGDIHIHQHPDKATEDLLKDILNNVITNQKNIAHMNKKLSDQLDLLTDKVAAEGSVVNGLVTLLNGVSAQLKDALSGENVSDAAQAKIDAVFSSLDSQKQTIADAIVANTTQPSVDGGTTVNTGAGEGGATVDTGNAVNEVNP
jgi:translation initiation factor 2B subunit (eIF-2B alpha/beta/delta family)